MISGNPVILKPPLFFCFYLIVFIVAEYFPKIQNTSTKTFSIFCVSRTKHVFYNFKYKYKQISIHVSSIER